MDDQMAIIISIIVLSIIFGIFISISLMSIIGPIFGAMVGIVFGGGIPVVLKKAFNL